MGVVIAEVHGTEPLTDEQKQLVENLAEWMVWWVGIDDPDELPVAVRSHGTWAQFIAGWGDADAEVFAFLPDVSATEDERSYIGKMLALRWCHAMDLNFTKRGQLLVRA